MKIEQVSFGKDLTATVERIAEGEPVFTYYSTGHITIFIPTNGGSDGHVVTLSRGESEHLQ